MKNLSKKRKFKSMFIPAALAMVITLLPMSSTTVYADASTGSVSYFTADKDFTNWNSGMTVTGNVTWDDDLKAAKFEGSAGSSSSSCAYVLLDGKPLESLGATQDTGFTISFDAKIDQYCTDWGRVFDFGIDNSHYFFLNGGYKNSSYNYGGLGLLEICYGYSYGESSNWESYSGPSKDLSSSDFSALKTEVTDDTFDHYDFVVAPGGNTTLWVNNRAVTWLSNNNRVTSMLSSISQISNYYIGRSSINAGDGSFKGYIKNFTITANADKGTYSSEGTKYLVTFNANGHGTNPAVQSVLSGSTVTKPTDLTAEGYTFGGWYKEASCTNSWNFETDTVTQATTLYAKWTGQQAATVSSIAVKTAPTKTEYVVGESLDLTGAKITVTDSAGATSEVDVTADMVSGFDSTTTGTKTITITYGGQTTTFDVTVNDGTPTPTPTPTVSQIVLNTNPTKTTYVVGESLDLTGAKITVTDLSGTTSEVDVTADMVSGFDSTTTGTKTITITYGGQTATFEVTVNDGTPTPTPTPTVSQIAINTNPTKTEYVVGESLDLTGAKITVTDSAGATSEVDVTADMVSGFDSTTTGTKTITITYGGQTATFDVTVNDGTPTPTPTPTPTVPSIVMNTNPAKTTYVVGESLDLTGTTIAVINPDGTTSYVSVTADMVSGFDSTTAGTKTITVSYNGYSTVFYVVVNEAGGYSGGSLDGSSSGSSDGSSDEYSSASSDGSSSGLSDGSSSESLSGSSSVASSESSSGYTENLVVDVSSLNTVKISATISNGTAKVAEITDENISQVIGDGSSNTIKIDVSTAIQNATAVDISKSTIQRLTKTLKDKNNKLNSVLITTKSAKVQLDAKALAAVSSQAEGDDIKLVVENTSNSAALSETQQKAISGKEVAGVFEAYFESNGQRISNFKGGSAVVTISFRVPEGKDKNFYHVEYVSEDGKITRYQTKFTADGLQFTTTHFSDYCIVYDTSAQNATNSVSDSVYTVVKGDCMYNIARSHNMTLSELAALNPQVTDLNLIYPGDEIIVTP